jgi:hypothetical protein
MCNPISFLKLILIGSILNVTVDQAAAQPPNVVTQAAVLPEQSCFSNNHLVNQVLGVPSSFCGHVIDRLMENQMRQHFGNRGYNTGPAILLPGMPVPLQAVDVQLRSVQLISDTNGVQGPVFLMTLQNQSSIPVGDFRVTLVAVTGTIQTFSPSITGSVQRVDAGAVVQFQLQLPVCHFDTLVVSIDSFDELPECDELNNVQILSQSDIPLVVLPTTLTSTSEPLVAPSTLPGSASAPHGGATIVPDSTSTPGDQALPNPSPLDGIDLDQLQPDQPDAAVK